MNLRVLRSAAILKRLVHHPNIVHLLEVVKDNGKFILIQEYVEGPTLQQLLEQNISPLDKESFFLQLVLPTFWKTCGPPCLSLVVANCCRNS
jgi:serine/threonine protein kinase